MREDFAPRWPSKSRSQTCLNNLLRKSMGRLDSGLIEQVYSISGDQPGREILITNLPYTWSRWLFWGNFLPVTTGNYFHVV